jgi:hypothetical protein
MRKQGAENLLLLCGSCTRVSTHSPRVTAPRRPLSAAGSQADITRIINYQQDSVCTCGSSHDTVEYFIMTAIPLCSQLQYTVNPRVTTGLTYDQLGLRPKFLF